MTFKNGDRVRVYVDACRIETGRVNGVGASGPGIDVLLDGGPTILLRVHPKQCRRLKSKALREFWILEQKNGLGMKYIVKATATKPTAAERANYYKHWTHVREVKP